MIYNPKAETMSKDELHNLQSRRLVRLVNYVYEKSAFYKRKFDEIELKPSDIKSIEDIVKLPFTNKTDLRDNYPFGVFSMPPDTLAEIHVSSGTTGNPTLVGYSKKDLLLWSEVMARALSCAGVHKNDIIQIAYGYGLFTGGFGAHYGALKLGATILPMSAGHTNRQVVLMNSLRPRVLACTPSYALYLSEEATNLGLSPKDISWEIGIFGGEPWSENMRSEVERRLGIKAYDVYGLSEIIGPGVSIECQEQSGAHIWSDVFYPEIIDVNTNKQLPEGENGELVITTLTKQGIPLLRYRTLDIVSLNTEPCSCGRTSPRISKIQGRVDDMMVIRGINVFPSQIEHVLLEVGKGITPNYQIIVDRGANYQDTIEIVVELDENIFSDSITELAALEKNILKKMVTVLTLTPKLRLVPPNTIERSTGKAKRFIDKRHI